MGCVYIDLIVRDQFIKCTGRQVIAAKQPAQQLTNSVHWLVPVREGLQRRFGDDLRCSFEVCSFRERLIRMAAEQSIDRRLRPQLDFALYLFSRDTESRAAMQVYYASPIPWRLFIGLIRFSVHGLPSSYRCGNFTKLDDILTLRCDGRKLLGIDQVLRTVSSSNRYLEPSNWSPEARRGLR